MHHCTIARARAEIGPPKLRAFFGGAPQPISHNKRMPLQERPARAGGDMRRVAGGSAPSPRAVRVAQLAVPHPASSSQMSMARGRRKTYAAREGWHAASALWSDPGRFLATLAGIPRNRGRDRRDCGVRGCMMGLGKGGRGRVALVMGGAVTKRLK